ncbi:MAG: aquaporin [Chloroflexi bacterium]|nr:aquaporin [Chloroflexota bacterium]
MGRDVTSAFIAEALGTFLFLFVGIGSVVAGASIAAGGGDPPGLLAIALAHGLALAVLVSALGALSGAHFNPAVTFAVWLSGRIPAQRAIGYVAAQLLGAVLAGLAVRITFEESAWRAAGLGTPALGGGVTPIGGIAIEAVLTVLLVVAVFGTAIDPRGPKVGGLAIGFAVAADILAGGPLTGAAMNPARWFGPAIAGGSLNDWYVWILGPLVGAAVGAAIYRLLLPAADLARAPGSPTTPDDSDVA